MAHLHRGRWRVKWYDKQGAPKSRTFPSRTPKKTVDDFEQRLRLGLIDKSLIGGDGILLRDYVKHFMEVYPTLKKRALSTQKKDAFSLRCHILPKFGSWEISAITAPEVLAWQLDLSKDLAPQSVNNTVSCLATILRLACLEGKLAANPCGSVPRVTREERLPTFWTQDEINRFLAVARVEDYRVFQIVAFTVMTGLRPGEVMGLLRDCLDFDGGYVEVRRKFCTKQQKVVEGTKTGKSRVVPVPGPILAILSDKRTLPPEAQVFPDLSNSFGVRFIRPIAAKAKVKQIRFHDLRHTYASHLVLHGKHPVEIKELLGHKKLSSTDVYMHLVRQVKQGATDCLLEGLSSLTGPGGGNVVSLFGS